jgi:desulfoferrodoxin (superoxide reductase-like protein)
LQQQVDNMRKKEIPVIKVGRVNDKQERICIAQGYEVEEVLTTEVNGQMQIWTERRLLIQSMRAAEAAEHSL